MNKFISEYREAGNWRNKEIKMKCVPNELWTNYELAMHEHWMNFERTMNELWTNYERTRNELGTNYKWTMKELWTNYEQTMNELWTNYMNKRIKEGKTERVHFYLQQGA